jgi:hypothetical protein
LFILPVFATVICIAFAIVVDYEVILIESLSDNLLVAVFVDGLVELLLVLDFV